MMTHKKIFVQSLFFTMCALFLISGCTNYNYTIPPVSNYPQKEKINLRVELRMLGDIKDAQWKGKKFTNIEIPMGKHFNSNVETVAKNLFSSVVMGKEDGSGSGDKNVGAILTARLVLLEQSERHHPNDPQSITAAIEWRVEDISGKLIWVETLKGTGVSEGFSDEDEVKKRLEDLYEEIFRKSFDAMASSPEIKKFAESRLQSSLFERIKKKINSYISFLT